MNIKSEGSILQTNNLIYRKKRYLYSEIPFLNEDYEIQIKRLVPAF